MQMDIIIHEKSQCSNFLKNLCCLNDDNEYSLHHEFSGATTEADERCVKQIVEYMMQRGNHFEISNDYLQNIVTGIHLEITTSEFLLNCINIGEDAYAKFRKSRLDEKSTKLFEVIPKTCTSTKVSTHKKR